jgi:cell wall-associated NlpC family hydrolase
MTHARSALARAGAVVFALVFATAVAGLTPTPAQAADRTAIVNQAFNQLNMDSHNHEIGGYNCNFYTSYFGAGSASCSNGWRSEEWCADFAHFVWGYEGVAYASELNAAAYSFYSYGVRHGTWHGGNLSGIQPGDVIVWGLNTSTGYAQHVAIYVGNSEVISGNAGPNDTQVYEQLTSSLNSVMPVSGYSSPV